MQEWEYLVETIVANAATVEARINSYGICGWRLVAVQGDRYFFERPR